MYAGHLDLTQPLLWTVDDILRPDECQAYIQKMRLAQDAPVAPITGKEGEVIDTNVRSNTRLMYDDDAWADELHRRLQEHIPKMLLGRKVANVTPAFDCIDMVQDKSTAHTGIRPSSSPISERRC
jgi:hypothetical protein